MIHMIVIAQGCRPGGGGLGGSDEPPFLTVTSSWILQCG